MSLTIQCCMCISNIWSLTCLIRPLSATLAASSSVSKQPRNTRVEWPACSVGSVRLTAHLLRSADHVHQWTWRGGSKLANCCKSQCMDNNMRSHGLSITLGSTKSIRVLCTQSCNFMLVTFATKLLATAAQWCQRNCLLVLKAHLVLWPAFVACIACLRFSLMNLLKSAGWCISSSS